MPESENSAPTGLPDSTQSDEEPTGVATIEPLEEELHPRHETDDLDEPEEHAPAFEPVEVHDRLEIDVPKGTRVVVVSDIHLGTVPTVASNYVASGLGDALNDWAEPGVLVIAGDGFELLAGPPDVGRILEAHRHLAGALAGWNAKPDHRLVLLPGNHDGRLAWDQEALGVLRRELGQFETCFGADLIVRIDGGERRVAVVHGNQFDRYNAFVDPRSPIDTPLGHHIVWDLLPEIEAHQGPDSPLSGIQGLSGDLGQFVGSRLLYRTVVGRLWWLAVPFAAALLLRCLAIDSKFHRLVHHHTEKWLILFGIAVVFLAATACVAAVATMLRVNRTLSDASSGQWATVATHNAAARTQALKRVQEDGYAGLISGHTHEPELAVVGTGFYANTGCGVEVVVPRRSRFGLPRPYVPIRRFSYVQLRGDSDLEVDLHLQEIPAQPPRFLERLALANDKRRPTTMSLVASLPTGSVWPIDEQHLSPWLRRRKVRRVACAALVLAGVLNIVFACLRPVKSLRGIDYWLPFGVHPMSGVVAVVSGLALAGLGRGLIRGYRRAWGATIIVLVASSADRFGHHKGFFGSMIAAAIVLCLVAQHRNFAVSPEGWRRRFGYLVTGALIVLALGTGLDKWFGVDSRAGRWGIAGAVVLAALLVLLVARPGREHRRTGAAREEAETRARAIIDRYGGDTLDYFALRDDKSWFFSGETLIAYSVINRVMLVSPDPIGPVEARSDAWADAMELANSNGWSIAVLAAGDAWLPIYRAAGLIDVYMGDEATVDCQKFTLNGRSMKSLRGAYNRVKKSGCRVELMDPLNATDDLRQQLLSLMTETRQGDTERGYSMTLSRLFDRRDTGLLLAVCFDDKGNALAFNQYIPAGQIHGFSLDLMRRTNDPDAPNGLTDFVIIETIEWMKKRGLRGLGLNFATLRRVIAEEHPAGPWHSIERQVLHHMSETMQIESLYRFNKKYDPDWRPRYAVVDSVLRVPRAGVAIARAEAVGELPVIGRLLKAKPTEDAERHVSLHQ